MFCRKKGAEGSCSIVLQELCHCNLKLANFSSNADCIMVNSAYFVKSTPRAFSVSFKRMVGILQCMKNFFLANLQVFHLHIAEGYTLSLAGSQFLL